jgi:DNA polymerase-1
VARTGSERLKAAAAATAEASAAPGPPKLYIIDLSSYIYRAYFAIRDLATSRGFPTNAIYGVTNMLFKVLRERQPTFLVLALDARPPTFRHQLYPEYKSHRPGMPADLVRQLDYIRRIIAALGLPTLEVPGFEADDLIATLTRLAQEANLPVEIISGDKDLLPLAGPQVTLWDPMRDVTYTPEVIREKFGLPPERLVDLRALTGDPSDNIPGVPGIGPKTAQKLLSQFGSLDALLAHLPDIKEKKLRERLEAHQEQARLSRTLLKLEGQVPLGVEITALQPGPWDRPALAALFAELEFSSLVKEISQTPEAGELRPVTTIAALEEVVAAIRQAGQVAVYGHSNPQHPMLTELLGLGLSWQEGQGVYLPLTGALPPEQVWAYLGPVWSDAAVTKISPDLKNLLIWGERLGHPLEGARGDILLASYLLNPVRYDQNLDNVALHHLGCRLATVKELMGRPLEAAALPLAAAVTYAGSRAAAAWRLWPKLRAELQAADLTPLYEDLELPVLKLLAAMETRGIGLDQDFLRRFGQDLEREMLRLEQEIYQLAGEEFLINSPQQLAVILFEKLKLPVQKKTRGRTAYSTDNEVLNALAALHPIAAKVIAYRTAGKLKSTYVDGLMKQLNPQTGRIHTTFVQSAAATGRLASREPNLQNIPVRGEQGGQIRQAFVAGEGQVFLSADYSQIELRLLAHFSEDPILLAAFQAGADIHRQTAAEVFGLHPELVSSEMRRQAKVINFGILYGMSAFGLAKQLGVNQRLAQNFIDRYFASHDRVRAYLEATLAQARQQGWVTTLRGRRRPIPHLDSSNRTRRQEAERRAVNTPLQGSAADLIKEAMLAVAEALSRENFRGQLLLQIHDELLLEVPREELAATAAVVRRAMENLAELKVPLIVDISVGKNWGELQPWRG